MTARETSPAAEAPLDLSVVPEWEPEILASIAAEVPAAEILAGPWGPHEARLTLARHGLDITAGGSIARVDLDTDELLALAESGIHPRAARKAARARELLTDLRRQLAVKAAGEQAWETRARRRAALQAWATWLRRELNAANVDLVRLDDPPPARRPKTPPTTRPRPASLPDAGPDEEPCAIPADQ